MATLTRQPFGLVTESRLRNLTNVKNKQNAVLPTPSKSLKRVREPEESFLDHDNENIDPAVFLSPSKKSKGSDGLAKPQNFFLKSSTSSLNLNARPIATPKRLSLVTTKATPISAPVGGRSPTKKRAGILSRRRVSSSPFTRVDPPAFARASGNGMPFSLDAALSGTIPSYTSKPSPVSDLKDGLPGKWFFEIHEDSPEEELNNLVEHSTSTLDISDDESKSRVKDERGKENIPPANFAPVAPVLRKDMMSDEARTPLGDLNPVDYFADGCDANSIIIVPEDQEITFDFDAAKRPEVPSELLRDFLSKTSKLSTPVEPLDELNDIVKTEGPIEIWESESAKDDESSDELPA